MTPPSPRSGFRTLQPDGAPWFTELRTDRVGRITTGGVLTEYPVPGVGPAGNPVARAVALWLTGFTSNDVVRMTTDGRITDRYPIPTPNSSAFWLVAGPDGNL